MSHRRGEVGGEDTAQGALSGFVTYCLWCVPRVCDPSPMVRPRVGVLTNTAIPSPTREFLKCTFSAF